MRKIYMNSIEFEGTIRRIYYKLKQIAEDPEWDKEDVDGSWLDDQYLFIKNCIDVSLIRVAWKITEDTVAADLVASALNTLLEMTEISFKEVCIECMSFLEDNYNL